MQQKSKNFYSLISNVMKLEVKYEKSNERYNHSLDIFNRYGKGDKIELSMIKSECEADKKKLDDLIKEISKLELDTTMQSYYDLYKQKSELTKQFWNLKTEIGYISSTLVFACMSDQEVDIEISNNSEELREQKDAINNQIKDITDKMRVIHSV